MTYVYNFCSMILLRVCLHTEFYVLEYYRLYECGLEYLVFRLTTTILRIICMNALHTYIRTFVRTSKRVRAFPLERGPHTTKKMAATTNMCCRRSSCGATDDAETAVETMLMLPNWSLVLTEL